VDCFPVTCSVPQGSSFGPIGLVAYTEDLTVMSEKHSVHSHTYADDIQHDSRTPADAASVRDRLCVRCCQVVCLAQTATECLKRDNLVWVAFQSCKLQRINQSLQVGPSNIRPSSVVRDWGVYLDSELTLKQHITKTAAACFYHICHLRQVCRRVARKLHNSWSWRS